jgi:hypothetical protein
MRPLQTFKHLTICFGMLCLFGVGAANAAPVCSQVFSSISVSPEIQNAALNDLAQMKHQLDHALLNGEMTLAQKALEIEFQSRFEETFKHFEGQLSKAEFKGLIRSRIIELQNSASRIERVKENQRQELNELIPVDRFDTERRQPDVVPEELVYVPAIDGLLLRSGTYYYKYDLKSKMTELVLDKTALVKQVVGTKLFYVLKTGQFASRDLSTGAEEVYFENVFKKHYFETRKALSKNGGWLAMPDDYGTSLALFNTNTQQFTTYKVFKKPSFWQKMNGYNYDSITRFQFISANELLIFSSTGKVMVLNIATGDRTDLKWPNPFFHDHWMKVTDDGYLIMGRFRTLGIVKIQDLANIDTKIRIADFDGSIGDVVRLNKGTLIAHTFVDNRHEVISIGTEAMQAAQVPVVPYPWQTSFGAQMAVDIKGGRVFLGGWNRDGVPKGSLDMFPMIEILTPRKHLK